MNSKLSRMNQLNLCWTLGTGERRGTEEGFTVLYLVPRWVRVPLDYSRQAEMIQGFEGKEAGSILS